MEGGKGRRERERKEGLEGEGRRGGREGERKRDGGRKGIRRSLNVPPAPQAEADETLGFTTDFGLEASLSELNCINSHHIAPPGVLAFSPPPYLRTAFPGPFVCREYIYKATGLIQASQEQLASWAAARS